MERDIYRILADRLRRERARAGWSLEELAERAGISGTFVAHIETGRKKPSLLTVHRLSRALNLPLSDLLKEDRQPLTVDDAAYVNRIAKLIRGKSARKREGLLRVFAAAADVVS